MLRGASVRSCILLIAATFATAANAVPLRFELTGSRSASFVLDSNPTPDRFSSSALVGDQIFFDDVSGIFAGVDGIASEINFGSGLIARLNILAPGLGFTQFSGPVLFGGTAAMPMFSVGVFELSGILSGRSTLTISEFVADVPAPGTAGLLLLGTFGVVGVAMQRRQSVKSASA